jgi:nicotinamide-nucleotide amidase
MDDASLTRLATRLGELLVARAATVATAESCTGGWVAKVLTDVPGSSRWFGYGLVTYDNGAKAQLLRVPADMLSQEGAVSEAVVRAMAAGARRLAGADYGVAISGIAGPDGGSLDKPVGTVWFAWDGPNDARAEARVFAGDREAVRRASVAWALQGLLSLVGNPD